MSDHNSVTPSLKFSLQKSVEPRECAHIEFLNSKLSDRL